MFKFLVPVLFFIITLFASGVSSVEAAGTLNITSCNATVDLAYVSTNIVGVCHIDGSTIVNPPNPLINTSGNTSDFNLTPGTYTYRMNCGGTIDTATIVVSAPSGGCGGGSYSISASPNPVQICSPATQGTTDISWTAPAGETMQVYVNGNLFSENAGSHSASANWIQPNQSYNFVLKSKSSGTERGNVTVTGTSSGCGGGGQCGGANGHTFNSSDTGYFAPYNQCNAGSPSSTSFPAQGGFASWTCNSSGGNSGTCTATRAEAAYLGPIVDLKTYDLGGNETQGPITISNGHNPILIWETGSGGNTPTSCVASGGPWSGSKAINGGSEEIFGLTPGTYTFSITCYKNGLSDTDSVTVNVTSGFLPGQCGGANGHVFPSSANGYTTTYNQCNAGSPSSTAFPAQGSFASWTCSGSGGGANSGTCTATRSDSGFGVGKKLIVCPVDPVSVLVGQTVPLVSRYWASAGSVTCNTSGYTDVTNSSSWSVSNEHGTVSNSGTKGVVTGVSVGTVRVAATYDGLTANKDVEVTDGTGGPYTPPPDIDIVADPRIIRSGETADVTVTVTANYPLTCQLYGAATGTFSHTTGTTEFDAVSSVLTSARIVRVICTDPGGSETQADARIEVIPTFQEI